MAKGKVHAHGIASPNRNMAGYRFGESLINGCYIYLDPRQKWDFYRSDGNVRLVHQGKCITITLPVDKFERGWTIIKEDYDEFI